VVVGVGAGLPEPDPLPEPEPPDPEVDPLDPDPDPEGVGLVVVGLPEEPMFALLSAAVTIDGELAAVVGVLGALLVLPFAVGPGASPRGWLPARAGAAYWMRGPTPAWPGGGRATSTLAKAPPNVRPTRRLAHPPPTITPPANHGLMRRRLVVSFGSSIGSIPGRRSTQRNATRRRLLRARAPQREELPLRGGHESCS